MADSKVLELTDANWEEAVLNADKPVLVDFWATWCGPCKMIAPIIEQMAGENEDVVFGKMDVQKNMTGTQYGVAALPTLMIFKGGEKVDSIVGVPTKKMLADKLAAVTAPA